MKKNKNNNIDYDELFSDIINCLMYENQILRKKQKGDKLTPTEECFDLIFPPSSVLKLLSKSIKKENKK